MLLQVENAYKAFGANAVLKGISFAVDAGEAVAVIGPSGSGKSTLLRCCTTLETLDKGSIFYHDDALVRTDEAGQVAYADPATTRRIQRRFGLVFQNFTLFPHFSVLQNVTEALVQVLKIAPPLAREQALNWLQKMGLADKSSAYPGELSGGQQQRVAIARALALGPEILFFDEPTSALDPELTGEVLRVIRGLAAEHMTMVIVTHEMLFARDVADRVIFMDNGVIVEAGAARQVIDHPQAERTRAFLQRHTQQ
jgi:polar amino acid transport system ATP-binding protein